ncbi:hypothetical protein Clacol_004272 [Clathrus columnatus]|uniref:L-tryptophan decarboxylase PsiD-like domain-containing protein n=1 Tax=Clathrus columnatus TaxID=1419009 RepID=A0AAV5AAK1_9AGAM|nr:hypothetical protein Clacol_004272 [Clathrus columnatus]
MSKVLPPSADAFRKAGWIAAVQATYTRYILVNHLLSEIKKHRDVQDGLIPVVQEFKNFIETDPVVFTDFIRMFDGTTEPIPTTFGSLGPPVYMIMAQTMNTQGGFSAHTKEILSVHFQRMFETWSLYLNSKDSRSVLNTKEGG